MRYNIMNYPTLYAQTVADLVTSAKTGMHEVCRILLQYLRWFWGGKSKMLLRVMEATSSKFSHLYKEVCLQRQRNPGGNVSITHKMSSQNRVSLNYLQDPLSIQPCPKPPRPETSIFLFPFPSLFLPSGCKIQRAARKCPTLSTPFLG